MLPGHIVSSGSQVVEKRAGLEPVVAARRHIAGRFWEYETIDLVALERYRQSERRRRTKQYNRHRHHKQWTQGATERSRHLGGGARALGAECVSLAAPVTLNCCIGDKLRGFVQTDWSILDRTAAAKVWQNMPLTRERDERVDSLTVLGTVNLRWPDDRIFQ